MLRRVFGIDITHYLLMKFYDKGEYPTTEKIDRIYDRALSFFGQYYINQLGVVYKIQGFPLKNLLWTNTFS